MMTLFWLTFYLALPAFVANMVPILASKLNWFSGLDRPIDGGLKWRGHRVFGANKTWRGLVVGSIFGALIGFLFWVLDDFQLISVSLFQSDLQFMLFGFFGGLGALLGDAVESFFKRQIGIKPGRPFIPFDQIDYLIGFLLFTWPLVNWSWSQVLILLICGLVLNPITNVLAYVFKIKKTYW